MKPTILLYFGTFCLFFFSTSYGQINYSQAFNSNSGSWTSISYTNVTPCNGSGSVRLNLWSSAPSLTTISPSIGTSNGGDIALSLKYKITDYSTNNATSNQFGSFKIQYATSTTGTWYDIPNGTIGSNHIPSTSCTSLYLSFTPPIGTIYLRIKALWNSGDYYLMFDDIVATQSATPSCFGPSQVGIGNIGMQTSTLSWTAPSSAPSMGYEYYYSLSNTSPSSGTTASGSTTSTSANLSSLNPSSTYYCWVRSVCSASNKSSWVYGGSFTTKCAATSLPYAEGFNSSNMPSCWSNAWVSPQKDSKILYVTNSTSDVANPKEGTHFVKYESFANTNGGAGSIERLYTPIFSTIGTTSVDLSFFWFQNNSNFSSTTEGVTVEWSTNGTTWTSSNFYPRHVLTAPTAGEWSKKTITLPSGAANQNTLYIAFKFYSDYGANCYLDQVNVNATPTCQPPTAIAATSNAPTQTNVLWTAPLNLPNMGYEYLLQSTNSSPSASTTATGFIASGNSQTINGLTPNTVYYLWMRSVCASSDKSPWASGDSFMTTCYPITSLPWSEGFENLATLGYDREDFPPCWKTDSNKWGSTNGAVYNTANSGNNFLFYRYGTTHAVVWTPGFQLNAGISYDFSFYAQGDGSTSWINDMYVHTSRTTAGATKLGATYTPTGNGVLSLQPYVKIRRTFVPSSTGTYYFGIRGNESTGMSWSMTFDDFGVEQTPTCAEPTSLGSNNITDSSVQISWQAPATAPSNGYEYVIKTNNINPQSTTPANGSITSGTSTTISGLLASTTYYFWVRSICSNSDQSAWINGGQFKTRCSSITVPSNLENFNQFPPECWTFATGDLTSNAALTYQYNNWYQNGFFANNPNNSTGMVSLLFDNKKDWLMTPSYQLGIAPHSYRLKYKYAITQGSDTTKVLDLLNDRIDVVISTNNGTTWSNANILKTYTGNAIYSNSGAYEFIPLSNYNGKIKIAFVSFADSANLLNIEFHLDELAIEETPIPKITSASITSNCTPNTKVILIGNALDSLTSAMIGGTSLIPFDSVSSKRAVKTISSNCTGKVTIANAYGSDSSSNTLNYTYSTTPTLTNPNGTAQTLCSGIVQKLMINNSPNNSTISWSPIQDLYIDSNAQTLYTVGTPTATIYAKPTDTTTYVASVQSTNGCSFSLPYTLNVRNASKLMTLPTTSIYHATAQCTEGDGWTYYALATSPNQYIFGLNKSNTTLQNESVSILVDPLFQSISSNGTNQEHGSFLMTKGWNVDANNFSGNASVRFFFAPSDTTIALNLRDSLYTLLMAQNPNTSAIKSTQIKWFKSTGTPYNNIWKNTILGNKFPANTLALTPIYGTKNNIDYVEFQNLTSFSGGSGGYSYGTPSLAGVSSLAVTWSDIYGEAAAYGNHLFWTTESEQHSNYFQVEYSNDGIHYIPIAEKINAATNSTTKKTYAFFHKGALNKRLYYRVREIDLEGLESISQTIVIKRSPSNESLSIWISPMPIYSNQANLQIANHQFAPLIITLYNTLGVPISSMNRIPKEMLHSEPLEVSSLTNGVYYLTIKHLSNTYYRQIIVDK